MTDMVEVDGESNYIYIYNGIDSVPSTVTHLRVDPSVTEIPNEAFQNCVSLKQVECGVAGRPRKDWPQCLYRLQKFGINQHPLNCS